MQQTNEKKNAIFRHQKTVQPGKRYETPNRQRTIKELSQGFGSDFRPKKMKKRRFLAFVCWNLTEKGVSRKMIFQN